MPVRAAIAQSNEVRIHFTSKVLFATIREIISLRSLTLENYLLQLAEADAAEHRRLKLRPTFLQEGLREKSEPAGKKPRHRVLSPDEIAEAISLYQTEGLTICQVAKRFSRSPTRMGVLLREAGCNVRRNV